MDACICLLKMNRPVSFNEFWINLLLAKSGYFTFFPAIQCFSWNPEIPLQQINCPNLCLTNWDAVFLHRWTVADVCFFPTTCKTFFPRQNKLQINLCKFRSMDSNGLNNDKTFLWLQGMDRWWPLVGVIVLLNDVSEDLWRRATGDSCLVHFSLDGWLQVDGFPCCYRVKTTGAGFCSLWIVLCTDVHMFSNWYVRIFDETPNTYSIPYHCTWQRLFF